MTLVQTSSLMLNKTSSEIKYREKYFISWISVFPEKRELDIGNLTVEFPIGKALEQSLQDKKQKKMKIHPFGSSTLSTCLSHKKKKEENSNIQKVWFNPTGNC